MSDPITIEADWTWTGSRFESGVQVAVAANGRIESVGRANPDSNPVPVKRLTDRALLPGMINVHSHAFQRALRGQGETFPKGAGSFWTWREAMYRLVDSMDAETLYEVSRQAFVEMLGCGITTVGEFHYLHHDATLDGFSFDELVLRAASDAGIRIALLCCYYRTGAIGKPLSGGQRRFDGKSLETYLNRTDGLRERLESQTQSMGIAPHSIRAVALDEIVTLHAEAARRGLPFHIHVEEQVGEVEECLKAYGARPMTLLLDRLQDMRNVTVIHGTHATASDLTRFAQAGGTICLCPLTEGNLGDGFFDLAAFRGAGGRICIGTDSNARLCMTEELRWLEYAQRLKTRTRGCCTDESGGAARALFEAATENGAAALRVEAGRIAVGRCADFIAVDLNASALSGWTPDTLLDAFVFGTSENVVAGVCVGGRWVRPVTRVGH